MEGIEFEEDDGKIKFRYTEKSRDDGTWVADGIVPKKIIKQGKKAILKYALHKVNLAKKRWKKWDKVEDDIRKNHIPIQATYEDGTHLEGRIVEATDRCIKVELDSPLKGSSEINFGFASAMSGHYVFADNFKISQHGYNGAREALCGAYKNALNKSTKDLVGRLNRRR